MIIIKDQDLKIPKGISPNFVIETSSGECNLQDKSISIVENGITTITPDEGFDGMSSVDVSVNVPIPEIKLETRDVDYTQNGEYEITPQEDYDGISSINVSVNVPEKKIILQNKEITENGSVTADPGFDGLGTVDVNVPIPEYSLEEQTISKDNLKSYLKGAKLYVTPHDGYDALSKVTINKLTFEGKSPIEPSTEQQVISPSNGYDGFDVITVNPVTANIDDNIQADNIKKGVSILGVDGEYEAPEPNLQEKTISKDTLVNNNASSVTTEITPDDGYDGISKLTVDKVNLQSTRTTTIKTPLANSDTYQYYSPDEGYDGIKNFGVKITSQSKTVTPSTNTIAVTPDTDIAYLERVVVYPANIGPVVHYGYSYVTTDKVGQRQYLKIEPDEGEIGIAGCEVEKIAIKDSETITPTRASQTITYDGYMTPLEYSAVKKIIVNPVTANIDDNIQADNIKKGINILGVEGTYDVPSVNLQEKTISKDDLINLTTDIVSLDITPDEGFDGISKLSAEKVNLQPVRTTTITTLPGTNYRYFEPPAGYDGFKKFGFKLPNQSKTVDASINSIDIMPDAGYTCLRSVTINPVTASIDSNIQAENIKKGVSILGIIGTLEEGNIDKVPLKYIECDGNTFFKLIDKDSNINLNESYTCDIQCSITRSIDINNKTNLLNFINSTDSSHTKLITVKFGTHPSYDHNVLQVTIEGTPKVSINNSYKDYTLGDETCIDVQIHNSKDSSTASGKVVVTDISGGNASNINTVLPNELIAFGDYDSTSGKLKCTSSTGYRIHRVILHRDQIKSMSDKTRTYYEFVPVLHDGQPCFYETQHYTYHYNLGTGTPGYELL